MTTRHRIFFKGASSVTPLLIKALDALGNQAPLEATRLAQQLIPGPYSLSRSLSFTPQCLSRRYFLSHSSPSDFPASEETSIVQPRQLRAFLIRATSPASSFHVALRKPELGLETGLSLRDIRAVDPSFQNQLPSILARSGAIVVNLSHVKAILLHDRAYLFNCDSFRVKRHVIPQLKSKLGAWAQQQQQQQGQKQQEEEEEGQEEGQQQPARGYTSAQGYGEGCAGGGEQGREVERPLDLGCSPVPVRASEGSPEGAAREEEGGEGDSVYVGENWGEEDEADQRVREEGEEELRVLKRAYMEGLSPLSPSWDEMPGEVPSVAVVAGSDCGGAPEAGAPQGGSAGKGEGDRVQRRSPSPRSRSPPPPPFEFLVLEVLLDEVERSVRARFMVVMPPIVQILQRYLTDHDGFDLLLSEQQQFLRAKNRLLQFEMDVREICGALKELLLNDEDLLDMYLSRRASATVEREGQEADEQCQGTVYGRQKSTQMSISSAPDDHSEVEELLEDYFKRVEEIGNEVDTLKSTIDATSTYLGTLLDSSRNKLIRLDVLLNMATCSLAVGGTAAAVFGMNLVSTMEDHPYAFVAVSAGVAGSAVFVFAFLYMYARRKRIL